MEGDAGFQVWPWVWEKRDEVAKSAAQLYEWFRCRLRSDDSERPIVMLGAGGVGKTTLAKILTGEFDFLLDLPGEYEESIGVETFELQNGSAIEVVVPPGQTHRREATWSSLLGDVGDASLRRLLETVDALRTWEENK